MDSSEQWCEHKAAMPKFDYAAASGLASWEVRKQWPRFSGPCPECGQQVILYASMEHYLCGDW